MRRPCRAKKTIPRHTLTALAALSAWATLLFVSGCDRTASVDPAPGPGRVTAALDSVETPAFWIYHSRILRPLRVTLSLPADQRTALQRGSLSPPAVAVRITPPGGGAVIVLPLKDDGGVPSLTGLPSFVDQHSGDLIPGDLVYSIRLDAGFADSPGTFLVTYAAGDLAGTPFDPAEPGEQDTTGLALFRDTLVVAENNPPDILSFNVPDSLHSGFDEQVWTAEVTDPDEDGGDYVTRVELELALEEVPVRTVQFAGAGAHVWTFNASADFAAGLSTGDYRFRLSATDRFEAGSAPVDTIVWVENAPPVLSELAAPDTVVRPLEGQNVYTFSLRVEDEQGQGDIAEVVYLAVSPQGDTLESPDFTLQDLGQTPDETAGDGTWSAGFITVPENSNFGTWTFLFVARDRGGNESAPLEKSIEFVDNPGVAR